MRLFLVLPFVGLIVASCTEPVASVDNDGCVVDADCATGLLCVEGACVADPTPEGCSRNGDCDSGFVCRDGGCVDAPAAGDCRSDADCDVVDQCDTGACLPSPACANAEPGVPCDDGCYGSCVGRAACDGDEDCEPVEACDDTFFVCLPIGDCAVDGDCPDEASCLNGACTQNGGCTVDVDCPATQHCADGVCTRNDSCVDDAGCPADERCVEGQCTRRDSCVVDDECAFDETCEGGVCTVIGDCEDVDDCPVDPGIACLDGTCTRAPCGRDSDCDDGAFCNGQETCNPRVGCADGEDPASDDLPACATELCDEDRDVLIRTGRNEQCGDSSPCTDDICDTTVGCIHPANDFQPAPGPAGDCERTICQGGAITVVDADNETPADPGSPGDCARAICQGGNRVLVPNDNETPTDVGPITDCKRAVCSNGARLLINDDGETPVQGPQNDCRREICQGGLVFLVDENGEVPPQGPATDCRQNVCNGGISVSVANDNETPVQGPNNDCKQQTCVGGAIVATNNDAEVPPQGLGNDCKREVCSNGAPAQVGTTSETPPQRSPTDCTAQTCSAAGTVVDVPAAETPPQRSPTDCTAQTCSGGAVVDVAAAETPPQLSTTDCTTQQCSGGVVVNAANNNETPPQGPSNDCKRETCGGGAVVLVNENGEVPPQGPSNDCFRETCSAGAVARVGTTAETPPQNSTVDCKRETCSATGAIVSVNNDNESPADVGCRDGVCSGGVPTTTRNNGNCVDTESCTVGTCNVDGTCSQVEQDSLCSCAAGQTGICEPSDPRAPNSGANSGCVCLTPKVYVIGELDGDRDRNVLEPFKLFTRPDTASGGIAGIVPGTTFVWDLAAVPAGVDPAAQFIGNPTSAGNPGDPQVIFQATSPSATSPSGEPQRDYIVRVSIFEPNLPVQVRQMSVSARKIPDTLEVTLALNSNVGLDVDLHLIGGPGSRIFDMPFHRSHDTTLGDDPDRDCYWSNCEACTVTIPGQPACTLPNPRLVDFDNPADGVSLSDAQDPQLDIDNQRGCFTAANGDLSCIPEKITVLTPAAGTYNVFAYLWGNALATSPGLASTPSSTGVTITVQCRGVTRSYQRTLSSIASGGGVAASNDEARYGVTSVPITIPAAGACTLP